MVNWNSIDGLVLSGEIYVKVSHVVTGIFLWEFLTSLKFDWEFLTLEKTFRWPHVFYFLNRYVMLITMILVLVITNQKLLTEQQCLGIEVALTFFGSAAIGLANINMAIRTVAIWGKNIVINIILSVLIAVHWAIIIFVTQSLTKMVFSKLACLPGTESIRWQTVLFNYATAFDIVILLLNVYKLMIANNGLSQSYGLSSRVRSRVTYLLFTQGLMYFIVACLANVIAIIFMVLNYNLIMNIIFTFPAQALSTVEIIACRAVRTLTNHGYDNNGEVTRFNAGRSKPTRYQHEPIEVATTTTLNNEFKKRSLSSMKNEFNEDPRPIGVLVHMETRVQTDAELPPIPTPESSIKGRSEGGLRQDESV